MPGNDGRMSALARRAVTAQQTGECFVVLVTLSHPTLPEPIRVGSDGIDTYHAGLRYQHFPFEVNFPEQSDGPPPTVTLKICNVDRQIVASLRTARTTGLPIQVQVQAVLASTPDVIEAGPYRFTLREANYDAIYVEAKLAMEDLLNAPFPAHEYTPATHPGMFA